ncbi:hypothetical protein O1L60_13245 [Streptomyces diastatochromogenes]|nr:hypothetical protein [Streptomyces diastatochromogenes]
MRARRSGPRRSDGSCRARPAPARRGVRLPGRARLADAIPFKMIVVDRTVAALPLDLELLYNGCC